MPCLDPAQVFWILVLVFNAPVEVCYLDSPSSKNLLFTGKDCGWLTVSFGDLSTHPSFQITR